MQAQGSPSGKGKLTKQAPASFYCNWAGSKQLGSPLHLVRSTGNSAPKRRPARPTPGGHHVVASWRFLASSSKRKNVVRCSAGLHWPETGYRLRGDGCFGLPFIVVGVLPPLCLPGCPLTHPAPYLLPSPSVHPPLETCSWHVGSFIVLRLLALLVSRSVVAMGNWLPNTFSGHGERPPSTFSLGSPFCLLVDVPTKSQVLDKMRLMMGS